nr:osteocalcin [Anolis sagrei ordinatus]
MIGGLLHPSPTIAGSSSSSDYGPQNSLWPPLWVAVSVQRSIKGVPRKGSEQRRRRRKKKREERRRRREDPPLTMKTLALWALLALAALALTEAQSDAADNSPDSEAFVSKRESAEVVKRLKRNYDRWYHRQVAAVPATPDPWEAHREVCELNPSCDELADQVGFQEAYRRFYGPL